MTTPTPTGGSGIRCTDFKAGDAVQITQATSSFKGCIGYIVRAHDQAGCWWVEVEGWSPMAFQGSGLVQV